MMLTLKIFTVDLHGSGSRPIRPLMVAEANGSLREMRAWEWCDKELLLSYVCDRAVPKKNGSGHWPLARTMPRWIAQQAVSGALAFVVRSKSREQACFERLSRC